MRGLTRRAALARLAQVSAATGLPFSFAAAGADAAASWPALSLPPVTAAGYGSDPDLIHPQPVPWPLTLSAAQRTTLARLANIIVPTEGDTPSAADVGAVDVLDEWVSAPYPEQQQHRQLLLEGLAWLDAQASLDAGTTTRFPALTTKQQLAIIDRIADPQQITEPQLWMPMQFFALLRQLVVGAFFTSPEGTADLGYLGNVAIAGDYPGPTKAAKAHLKATLKNLGLSPVEGLEQTQDNQ